MTLNSTARAGLAGTAALAALTLTGTSVAHAAPTPGVGAASYLAGRLAAGGNHLSTTVDGTAYTDYGVTNDAILALASLGAGQAEMNRAVGYMVAHGSEYYSYGADRYAGSLAKQIVMLQATGRAAGPLVTQLRGLESSTGRFSDRSDYGDYSNTISQAWSLIALKRAGLNPSTKAVSFLKAQQCADGGFRLNTGQGACVSDADVTSFAVQAMVASGEPASASRGSGYLAGKQQASGGVGGGPTTEGVNANSSGLAAVAFAITGRTANASRAAAFVKSLQFGCDAPTALRGAIAYDRAAYTAKLAGGVPSDQENRTTVQAALAFTLQPYLTITAHGAASATFDCATSTATTSATSTATASATSTPTTSATSTTTGTATTPVTGPPVVTDGPAGEGGADLGVLAGAGALLATIGAGAVAHGRRRK